MPTLYFNFFSQPSRAIWAFCHATGIEFKEKSIDLAKGEHKGEEYLKVHPHGQVPAWQEDDGSVYIESSSILRFLANKYHKTEFWPEDLIERQQADAGLDFNGTTVRPGIATALFGIVIGPKFFGTPEPSEEKKAELLKQQQDTLDKIEKWLEGKEFIGGHKLTLPDFQVFNELASAVMMQGLDLSSHKNISAWWGRCLENASINETHEKLGSMLAAMAG